MITINMSMGMICCIVSLAFVGIIMWLLYRNRSKCRNHPIVIGMSAISLTIAVTTAIYLCCQSGCFGISNINYGDTSVAVLTTIIGLLIGWSIYSVIDTKNIKKEYEKLKEEVAFALTTTKIDLFATAVTLNKDNIKGISNPGSQETDEFEFHMIENYLQLILSEIQAGFMDDAIIHKETMVRDVRNRNPRLNTRQINMVHRLCGFISAECNNRHIGDIGVTDIFSHIEIIQNK